MLRLLLLTLLIGARCYSRPGDAYFDLEGSTHESLFQTKRVGADGVAAAATPTLQQLGRHLATASETTEWPHGYLAICVLTKNQQQDIREWLHYHQWLGVGKVYLYDDNSTQLMAPDIRDFIDSRFVDYEYFIGKPKPGENTPYGATKQHWVYKKCTQQHSRFHRWMAFIDSDEFIVLHPAANTTNINNFLSRYERYGALGVNWILFGSSGHIARPQGGCLKNYDKCVPLSDYESTHVKIIANTKFLAAPAGNPHSVVLHSKGEMVTEKFEVVPKLYGGTSPWTPSASWDMIALYHYVLKSKEDFIRKSSLGSPTYRRKDWPYFEKIERLANATCTYGPKVWELCCTNATF